MFLIIIYYKKYIGFGEKISRFVKFLGAGRRPRKIMLVWNHVNNFSPFRMPFWKIIFPI